MTQNKVIVPRKNPITQVVKDETKVPDIDIKDENLNFFTDKLLRGAYNITVEHHHDKNVNSMLTVTPKYEVFGFSEYHIDKIVIELADIYATLVNRYKFKYQLSF